jgi:hypothetical protein
MPSGITPQWNAQKRLILLAKVNFLPKQHHGKACCDLRSEENFRQRRREEKLYITSRISPGKEMRK